MRSEAAQVLGRRRRRTLRALVPVVCPPDVVADGLVDDVVDHVVRSTAALSPMARRGLSAGLLVIELRGLRHGAPFSRLPAGRAEAAATRLSTGSDASRRLFRAVRDVIVVGYFDQPAVKDRLGYHPKEWTAQMAERWREQWGGEAERHRRLLRTRLSPPGGEV